jgi:hypothetical protein
MQSLILKIDMLVTRTMYVPANPKPPAKTIIPMADLEMHLE